MTRPSGFERCARGRAAEQRARVGERDPEAVARSAALFEEDARRKRQKRADERDASDARARAILAGEVQAQTAAATPPEENKKPQKRIADVLDQMDEGVVEPVFVVRREDEESSARIAHAIKRVEKAAEGDLAGGLGLLTVVVEHRVDVLQADQALFGRLLHRRP